MSPQEITFHEITYKAVESVAECLGCDLQEFSNCNEEGRECRAAFRDDGREIIGVKKPKASTEKKYIKIVEFDGATYGSLANEDCVGCAFESESIVCGSYDRIDQLTCTSHKNNGISMIWEKIAPKTVAHPVQTTKMRYATAGRKYNFPNSFATDDETIAKFVDDNYTQLCEDYDELTYQSFENFVTLIMKWAAK